VDINKLSQIFEARQANINKQVITKIAENIKNIGEADINKLKRISVYTKDLNDIARELSKTAKPDEIYDLYMQIAKEEYDRYDKFYSGKRKPLQQDKKLMQLIENQAKITAGSMRNLSNTTTVGLIMGKQFVPLDKAYKLLVDEAVQAVYQGADAYGSAKHKILKQIGKGTRVQYESGITRRLDTAARQNILDGVKALTLEASKQMGDEFGADGYEISAHLQCAPDHLPYQGKQYSIKEFEDLQNSLDRPFMEYNCTHTVYPIILGISSPTHSKSELSRITADNKSKQGYQGKDYTPYEATQMQRKIETEVRYIDDALSVAKAGGDKELQSESEKKRKQLVNEYRKFSKQMGLETQYARFR
jgi:hypothetical protein